MLIREYRILMPLSTEEYRIAQLYMVQKKSLEESVGEESGVEILENKPYDNGPGGKGQYTHKVYRIASHLPSWFRNLVPKNSLSVTEYSWNAYPYTKTTYEISFATSFKMEIETYYFDDPGDRNDVFEISSDEKKNYRVDYIDIVNDPLEYAREEENVMSYVSKVTGRGPLKEDWREKFGELNKKRIDEFYSNRPIKPDVNGNMATKPFPKRIMCSYKLCRVEFKYWGIQSKAESFIQDVALRKMFVRAHRQAWIWQDEWYGLSIEQIRELERKAIAALREKLHNQDSNEDKAKKPDKASDSTEEGSLWSSYEKMARYEDEEGSLASDNSFASCISNVGNSSYFNMQFEPCQTSPNECKNSFSSSQSFKSTSISNDNSKLALIFVVHGGSLYDYGADLSSKMSDVATFRSTLNSVIGTYYPVLKNRWLMRMVPCPPVAAETLRLLTKMNPCQVDVDRTIDSRLAHNFVPLGSIPILFTSSFDYQDQLKEVVIRLNQHYRDFLNSNDGHDFSGAIHIVADALGSIMIHDILRQIKTDSEPKPVINSKDLNFPNLEFQVCNVFLLGSPIGIVLAHRMIKSSTVKSRQRVDESNAVQTKDKFTIKSSALDPNILDSNYETTLACEQTYNIFHRTDPGAFRVEPLLFDVFNLFPPHAVPQYNRYPLGDGQSASLLELIMHNVEYFDGKNQDHQSSSAPVTPIQFNLSPYNKVQRDLEYNSTFSLETLNKLRKHWWGSKRIDYSVTCPEGIQNILARALPPILHASYWESKDVASFILRQILEVLGISLSKFAYSADMADELIMSEMNKIPLSEKSPEFHSSIHSNMDNNSLTTPNIGSMKLSHQSSSNNSKAKGKSRTHAATDRLKFNISRTINASSNHRANDIILDESQPQIINARFIYGNLDLLTLSNTQIDIYIHSHSPNNSAIPWTYLGKDVTNAQGRLSFRIPEQNRVNVGMYTVKLVPFLDPKNSLYVTMAIVKRGIECIVFSVDGSFAASLSIMGSDPKVHPGSVDVARHWQGLGYMIIYLSARPDMQHRKVQSWMAGHNFPAGFYYFVEGVSHDPLKQKEQILRKIIKKSGIIIHCAYGSSKDVSSYSSIGLGPEQILIIGKKVKRNRATNIVRYSEHLISLMNSNPLSRQAINRFNQVTSYSAFDLPSFNASTTMSLTRSTVSSILSSKIPH